MKSGLSIRKRTILNLIASQIGFVSLLIVAYVIATGEIEKTLEKDMYSQADNIGKSISFVAKDNPNGFKDKSFKQSIYNMKIGKSGYVYMVDSSGVLIVHPTAEGKDLSSKDFIQSITSDRGTGTVDYYTALTDQHKLAGYSYIKEWDAWVVPGINKADYFADIKKDFLMHVVLWAVVIQFLVLAGNVLALRRFTKGLKVYREQFDNFLGYLLMKSNFIEKEQRYSNDEFGQMLENLYRTYDLYHLKQEDDMRIVGEIVLSADKIEQGIFTNLVVSESENPIIFTLKNTINKMMNTIDLNMSDMRNVLNAYREVDFTKSVSVNERIKEKMLETMQSINHLGAVLSENAKKDIKNGRKLEENSSYLKDSMSSLSSKANEQAASLEETAAAVEEITSLTRGNSDNCIKMSSLGSRVERSVASGQELAEKTASSMDEINVQVASINEAITVIDQIAFQTNILSLNAAVEAATAGESGKGFAVVAQEVRNLATRSAEAAKEIKKLVECATAKADEGKNISSDMIEGYSVLSENINKTTVIIEDVANASREQIIGIEQINDAINLLDRNTQENASEAQNVANVANEVSGMAHSLVVVAEQKKTL